MLALISLFETEWETEVGACFKVHFIRLPTCSFLIIGYRRDSPEIMYMYLVYIVIASAERNSYVCMLSISRGPLFVYFPFEERKNRSLDTSVTLPDENVHAIAM